MTPSRPIRHGMLAVLLLLVSSAALLHSLPAAAAAAETASPTTVAFVGVWDRSMALVDAACREQGLAAVFAKAGDFGAGATTTGADDAAAIPLVFVLNLDAAESPALTERLRNFRSKNPRQRVLALDTRGSHADLDKAGLLEQYPKLTAYWRANGLINLKRLMQLVFFEQQSGFGAFKHNTYILLNDL